jgi:hypothetical protein
MESGYPANNTELEGGLSPAEKNLKTRLNWDKEGRSITITLDFHYADGVRLAHLTLFDIDADNPEIIKKKAVPNSRYWVDVISNIQATAVGGGTIYPTNVVGDVNNTVTGSGSTYAITGNSPAPNTGSGSEGGNVDIQFGSTFVTQIRYTWYAGPDTVTNPAAQHIGVYDFSYHDIPEFHPSLISASCCGLLVVLRYGRRFLSKSKP